MSRMLDAAIAAHPLAWREKYADVVRGTLMDVADDRGGRVPVPETVTLALGGLWMRARGSVAFWGGLVVLVTFVWHGATTLPSGDDGSLTSRALLLNSALGQAAVVLGLISGWGGARARASRIMGVGPRLRRLARESWPLLAVVAVAYLAAFVILGVRVGFPWPAWPAPLVVIGQLAFVLAAIAIGELVGAILPRVLAIFAAPAAVVALEVLLFATPTTWVLAPWGFYSGIAYVTDDGPFFRGYAVAAVIVVAAVIAVSLRWAWLRILPLGALVAAAVVGVTADERPYIEPALPEARPQSELVCSGEEPVVCLWPEQESAFGASYRETMSTAYAIGAAAGLPVDDDAPRSVARFGLTGLPVAEGSSGEKPSDMGLGISGLSPDQALNYYALSMTADYWIRPLDGDGESTALVHSIAVVLGVPVDKTWPAMVDPYTGMRQLDPAETPNEAEARALVERWLSGGVDGVRPPS